MKKTHIFIYMLAPFLAVFSSQILFANQTNHSHQEDVTKKSITVSKTCFVWFEVNDTQHLSDYLVNANEWQSVGQLLITSRKDNVIEFSETLMLYDPSIISGFKTYEYFLHSSIYDAKAWEEIARIARSVSKITRGKPVILENEGAVKHLLKQDIKSIDYKRLYDVIAKQKWPTIWFWYAPIGTTEKVQSMSLIIAKAITDGIPNSHLIEASSAGYAKMKQEDSILNLERTLVLDNNPLSIVYLDDERHRFWRYENTSEAIKQAEGEQVIIYPGFDDIQKAKYTKVNIRHGLCEGL